MHAEPTAALPVRWANGSLRAYSVVDAADHEWLGQWTWRLVSKGYAWRRADYQSIYLHRLILDAPSDLEVDHINGDRLDNRRANLRLVTGAQNNQNRNRLDRRNKSGFRGVSWDAANGRWRASAQVDGRNRNLGRYRTLAEAVAAASAFRREHMPYSLDARDIP